MTAHTVKFSMGVDDVFSPVFVAVATGVNTCQTNTDPRGGTWTSRTMPVSSTWRSVDYGNGMIVAVSDTSGTIAASSVDGTTWVQRTLPTTTTWSAVKYGEIGYNDKWVAVSSAGNYAATSPDGCTWTARSIAGSSYAWKSLSYGNGVWVALANTTTDNTLITAVSSDGITWSNQTATNITCPGDWSSITFGNGKFIAVCSGSNVAAYSEDGINWTSSTLPSSTAWVSVCYGNGVYIAVTATNSDKAARSTNGTSWEEITFPAASTWRAITYGKNIVGEGIFTSIGATTVSNYSLDGGVTWVAKTQISMTYTAACYAPICWFSADSLTIDNGAVLRVTTNQNKFWSTISINNGSLDISNALTSSGICFTMGRSTGSTAGTITPATGLGSISVSGTWIELGVGDGTSSQKMSAPFIDYIPSLWVETAESSGTYEQWLNVTGAYGSDNNAPMMKEGLYSVSSGTAGNFFVQGFNNEPFGPIYCTTYSGTFLNQRATRYIKTETTTSGIYPGAQVFGAGVATSTVVNRVISDKEVELNLPTAYAVRTDWSGIAYGGTGGTTYVAISKNYSDVAATSTDSGASWTKRSLPFKAEWSAICWGATSGVFVAVCKNSNLCATSPDGVTWTTRYLPTTQNWNAVASNGTSFVAVGSTSAGAATTVGAYSADGLTWAASTMTSAIWRSVAYGNSRYLAMSSTTICNYDADGAGTWTNGTAVTSANYISVVWNGVRFVAISGSSTVTRYTTDGVTWNNGGSLPNSSFTAMCWTGSNFVAVSTSSTAAQTAVVSTDGTSWTNKTLGVNQWSAVCFGGTVGIVVAGSNASNFAGSGASSFDATGVTWTPLPNIVSDVVLTFFNPLRPQQTNDIYFGDGVNGNKVPVGAKVRCPNIMVTSLAPANLHTSANTTGCSFVLTNGGVVYINTALFDECYHNFGQAQSLRIVDAGFSIPFALTECYDAYLERVAFALQPVRNYFTYPYWYSRDLRYGQNVGWNYINNAIIKDLKVCVGSTHARYGTTTATSPITLSYTDGATFSGLSFYSLNPIKANQTGVHCSAAVTNCTFDGCSFLGTNIGTLTTSSNNTFTNSVVSPSLYSGKMGLGTSGTRIGIDPETGEALISGKKYYFKIRSYRDWSNLDEYVEGPVVSATPFVGGKWFPPRFSAVNTASNTVTFNWDRRDPSSSSVACYEIFRGTSKGFARTLAARVYTAATPATITATDATVSDGNTYYYVMTKYDGSLAGITNSSGSLGGYTLSTAQNFLTGLGTIANCNGTAGARKVYIPSGSASNFLSGNVWVGMPISGGGLDSGTVVSSVDNELEITVSKDISSTFVGQTLSLGACAGLYVRGTGIDAGTKVVSVDSSTSITVDTAFSGAVSGTITFLYGTEGPEVEVYVAGAKQTASNLLFQSYDFTNATWVKTNISATAAIFFPPEQVGYNAASAPTALGVRIVSTGPSANMVNTQGGLTSSTNYCFSMYVFTPPRMCMSNTVGGTVTINTTVPTVYSFSSGNKWKRIEVPFTSTSTSHSVTVAINTDGGVLYASCAQINTGSTATVPVSTTTAAVTLNPVVQEITAAYAWGRTTGGTDTNQGVEIVLAAAPTGTHFSNLYMGTDSSFAPSVRNIVDSTIAATWSLLSLTTSDNTYFEGIEQRMKGQAGTLFTLAGSSNCSFVNTDYDFDYGNSVFINISNLSNNNFFHNFNISKFRNYIAASPLTTVNNASGLVLQNLLFDSYDLPIAISSLGTVLKGVSGGNAVPAGNATTWAMGGTLDGVGVSNVTVYDSIFNELYSSSSTGTLNLFFNASSEDTKPYDIISGSPTFSNTGRLYFMASGDSIEYTWPHLVKGVTGFRNITPKLCGADLGTAADALVGLKIEFAINNGAGYGSYSLLNGPNLYNTSITDATEGFGFKIKITCRTGMKYTSLTNSFILNEQIRGSTSSATAYVREINNLGTTGDIIVDTVVGSFIAGEAIVRASDSQARATNLATNTDFALFPSFSSYINGLQIYTSVDTSIKYPENVDPVSVSVVDTSLNPIEGARVRVVAAETAGGFTEGDVVFTGVTGPSGSISSEVPNTDDVNINIRVRKATSSPMYKPTDVPATIVNGSGLTMTIVLILDE